MTTGEIAHFAEVCVATVSKDTICKITDKVLEEMTEWRDRPLDKVYPVVFGDTIVVEVRDGSKASLRSVPWLHCHRPARVRGDRGYLQRGTTSLGSGQARAARARSSSSRRAHRDQESRRAGRPHRRVRRSERAAGVGDRRVALAIVQTRVIHLLRNAFRYASRTDWDALSKDLRRSTPRRPRPPRWPGSTNSREVGPGYHDSRVNRNRSTRNHVRELQAVGDGDTVILEPVA